MIDKNIPLDSKVLDDIEIFFSKEGFDEETSNVLNSIFSIRSLKIMDEQDDL